MAGDKGSRRFVRDWWVLVAFMLGAALGALASNAIGVNLTLWVVIGVGVPLLAVSVMFAHLEDRRRMTTAKPLRRTPRKTAATGTSVPSPQKSHSKASQPERAVCCARSTARRPRRRPAHPVHSVKIDKA
jgi:hypothetical protein